MRFLLVSGQPLEEPVAWQEADRDEYAGRATAGLRRAAERDLYQALMSAAASGANGLVSGRLAIRN